MVFIFVFGMVVEFGIGVSVFDSFIYEIKLFLKGLDEEVK